MINYLFRDSDMTLQIENSDTLQCQAATFIIPKTVKEK